MRIRQGTEQDLDEIVRILSLAVPLMQATGNQQWAEDYPNREAYAADVAHNELWVAELDGNVVGAAALCHHQSPEYAEVGWDLSLPAIIVHRLVVAPAARGKGVAVALMAQAEAVAHLEKIPRIRTDTNTENLAVQKLLSKFDYSYAGEISLRRRPLLRFRCYEKLL